MLITKTLDPRVILHVGASSGQEADYYDFLGARVLWIEPIPELFKKLQETIAKFPKQKAFQLLISNNSDVHNFTISSADGVSSSIFRFEPQHQEFWPGIEEMETVAMTSQRLDTFLAEQSVTPDTVVLDVEGAELLALEGMGTYLDRVRTLVVEYTTVPVLKGGVLFDDLNEWIVKKGFVLVDRQPIASQMGNPLSFGDALYIRDT